MSENHNPFVNAVNSVDSNKFLSKLDEKGFEIRILREEIQRFAENTGREVRIMHSGDLGAPFALNHRLDGVLHFCPFKKFHLYPHMIADIQNFNLEMHDGYQFLQMLMDEKLEIYTEDELKKYKYAIDSLLELIYIWSDPDIVIENTHIRDSRKKMLNNPESFKLITQTFKTASEYVGDLIDAKPILDQEPVFAKLFLTKYINIFRENSNEFWEQSNASEKSKTDKHYDSFIELVSNLPDELEVPRGEVIHIVQNISEFYLIRPVNSSAIINVQTVEDIKILIDELRFYQ